LCILDMLKVETFIKIKYHPVHFGKDLLFKYG